MQEQQLRNDGYDYMICSGGIPESVEGIRRNLEIWSWAWLRPRMEQHGLDTATVTLLIDAVPQPVTVTCSANSPQEILQEELSSLADDAWQLLQVAGEGQGRSHGVMFHVSGN